MTWTPINFEPGIYKDESPLKAQGYYIDADKIRFVNGLPETIYGWEKVSSTALTGLCRGAFTWQDNSRNAWASFGTHLRWYAMDLDGTFTDVTPATSYSLPSMSITTTNGSSTVTITGWTHGLVVDQKFTIANPSTTTVGGVTVAGTYTVLTVESTTSITFTAAQTASSAAGPTAITADVTIFLAPGQADGLYGLGYGTGGYGSGGYGGGSSAYAVFPRTWSFDQWGQNVLGSPRGDGIYEWAPNTTSTELFTNGNFSTGGGGWTTGTGWTVGSNIATATAGTGSNLEQSVTLSTGAWHLLSFNLTVLAGSMNVYAGTTTVRAGITSNGNYRLPFFSNGGSVKIQFAKDSSFGGVMRSASVAVLARGQLVTNAPTQVGSMFVTAERIVVACGSNLNDTGTGTTTFNPLQVDWSDAEDNQNWAPSSTNLSGGFTLPSGGRVVCGLRGARENVIWTTEALWSMRYVGISGNVYDFIQMGSECGLIGPNAAAEIGGVWYWMTPSGAFYAYGGAHPVPLLCTLSRDVKDNLAWVQGDKVYAWANVGKNYAEIWWHYPDSRDGTEVSRYVIYDTIRKTWSCGTFNRTAWAPASVFQFPLAVDSTGYVWYHEKDFTQDGGPRAYSLTSAFSNQPGKTIIVNGVRPDSDDLQGSYSISFTSKYRDIQGIKTRTYTALPINSSTGQKSVRVKGEQVGFTISGNSSPAFWRMGALQMDVLVGQGSR